MGHYWWLSVLGLALGAIGTLIGAGGGFLLVPALLLLYPDAYPETITSISLAVVFFNALSGSLTYARMGRVDYKSGLLLAAATVPGAIAGALTTDLIPRRPFNGVFGVLMIAMTVYLLLHRNEENPPLETRDNRRTTRNVIERNGTAHAFSYDSRLGMGISVLVGYVSSLLGIGGGVIHVPALVRLLNFPVHIATATSHFILVMMALAGTIVHIAAGSFSHGGLWRTIHLGIGVLLGAPIGALLSTRVHGAWIIRGLAAGLGLVGVRILIMAFNP